MKILQVSLGWLLIAVLTAFHEDTVASSICHNGSAFVVTTPEEVLANRVAAWALVHPFYYDEICQQLAFLEPADAAHYGNMCDSYFVTGVRAPFAQAFAGTLTRQVPDNGVFFPNGYIAYYRPTLALFEWVGGRPGARIGTLVGAEQPLTRCQLTTPLLPPLGPPGPDTGTATGGGAAGGSPPGAGFGGNSSSGSGPDGPPSCPNDGAQTTKPIIPATGEKVFNEQAYSGTGANALSLVHHFRSSWSTGVARVLPSDPGLGQAWAHNHAVSLVFAGSPATTASILIGDGSLAGFAWDSLTSAWKPAFGTNLLTPLAGGGFRFTRADDDTKWQFDSAGRLVSITLRNGWVTTYTYSDATASLAVAPRAGLLIRVTNQFGRSLGFVYNSAAHLTSVNTPDSQSISFSFDSSQRLAAVAYPGGVSKTYVYEDVNWPKSVTGIVDERGIRLATVAYDAQGRATSSGYTGGADQYSVAYGATATDPVQVIDPLGSARIYTYGLALNKLAVTSASRPSGSGNPDAASRVQNASGLIDSETDFLV